MMDFRERLCVNSLRTTRDQQPDAGDRNGAGWRALGRMEGRYRREYPPSTASRAALRRGCASGNSEKVTSLVDFTFPL